jgi:uncharacterized protein (DUF305 family)
MEIQTRSALHCPSTARRLLAAALVVVSFAAVPTLADGPAPTQSQSNYEIRFMTNMIDHHFMAVQMAELCQDRAVHEELLTLCQQIESTQQQEIDQMQAWLEDWYGVTYEPEMSPGDRQRMEQLAELFGEEFEIEFMQRMIRHHWKAVVRGSQCVDRAYHPELIEMCEGIVMTQTEEIRQMQTWLCDWYDICNYGPGGGAAE